METYASTQSIQQYTYSPRPARNVQQEVHRVYVEYGVDGVYGVPGEVHLQTMMSSARGGGRATTPSWIIYK